ncbi:MAG: lipocalin family protein [Planctomycetota bacterium]|jgi:apolipoprotein D and lipocalin family protein
MILSDRFPQRGALLRGARWAVAVLCLAILNGCAATNMPPLEATDRKVDLERFMGDWYVVGFIPVTIPFFSEEGAHNGVESYRLTEEGVIETTYTFRKSGFDGPEKRFTPKGWVYDRETNAEWRMQFLWPFKAAYLIVYIDDSYQETIIGVPSRKYVWIMTRDPNVSEAEYQELLNRVAAAGYDTERVQRVPQQWPSQ